MIVRMTWIDKNGKETEIPLDADIVIYDQNKMAREEYKIVLRVSPLAVTKPSKRQSK